MNSPGISIMSLGHDSMVEVLPPLPSPPLHARQTNDNVARLDDSRSSCPGTELDNIVEASLPSKRMLELVDLSTDELYDPKYKHSQKRPLGNSIRSLASIALESALDSYQVCKNVSKTEPSRNQQRNEIAVGRKQERKERNIQSKCMCICNTSPCQNRIFKDARALRMHTRAKHGSKRSKDKTLRMHTRAKHGSKRSKDKSYKPSKTFELVPIGFDQRIKAERKIGGYTCTGVY